MAELSKKRQKLRLKVKTKVPDVTKKLKVETNTILGDDQTEKESSSISDVQTNLKADDNGCATVSTNLPDCGFIEVVTGDVVKQRDQQCDVNLSADVLEVGQALEKHWTLKGIFHPKQFPISKIKCLDDEDDEKLHLSAVENSIKCNSSPQCKPFPKPCMSWLRRKPVQILYTAEDTGENILQSASGKLLFRTSDVSSKEQDQMLSQTNPSEQPEKSVSARGYWSSKSRELGTPVAHVSGVVKDDVDTLSDQTPRNAITDQQRPGPSADNLDQNHYNVQLESEESCQPVPLAMCPLCQMQFEQSMCQVDRDGHIASCLAASSDDVMW